MRGIEIEKAKAFEKNAKVIATALKVELIGRYRGENRRIEASFPEDRVLLTAMELLKNPRLYEKELGIHQ
jgi:hypothetical protein